MDDTAVHDMRDLGRILREFRRDAKLTQAHAAMLSGVSARLWSECETGKRTQVGFDTIMRMLHTVGADLEIRPRRRAKLPISD